MDFGGSPGLRSMAGRCNPPEIEETGDASLGSVTCADFAHIEVGTISFGCKAVAKNWSVTPANSIFSASGLVRIDFAEPNIPPLNLSTAVKLMPPPLRQKKPLCEDHSR